MKRWLLALGAGLLALGFIILTRDEKAAAKAGAQRDALILDGSKRAQKKAEQQGKKADKLQADAIEAGKIGKAVVDKVGTNSETIGSILDNWHKPDSV